MQSKVERAPTKKETRKGTGRHRVTSGRHRVTSIVRQRVTSGEDPGDRHRDTPGDNRETWSDKHVRYRVTSTRETPREKWGGFGPRGDE